MEPFELKECLDTFRIIVDTREQPTPKARKRYDSFGCEWVRKALDYGDYTYNIRLPDGKWLLDVEGSEIIKPPCAVERKMNLDELAQCFTHSRDRFEREFERASSNNARIHLLVENGSMEHLYNGKYRSKFHPNAFTQSVWAFVARYGMTLNFCKAETSGKVIRDILYRDCKERLERGELFDG